MRKLSETIARLAAMRAAATGPAAPSNDRLRELGEFGSNPGNLRGWIFVPEGLVAPAALVVVLHGCTQNAACYDTGSGWSTLAARHGFVVLYPEQQRANNPNLCFNWFLQEDTVRDSGEALSIRQMIGAVMRNHPIDPARVHITGLSAGGAMTSVMLATYPELFAGGAIIAGLPYGSATNMAEAFDRMRGGMPGSADLAKLVRDASAHGGPWPTVSVWHGLGDAVVSPANADAIVRQWRLIHGAADASDIDEVVDGQPRRAWRDARGRVVVEEYRIAGMAHGTPLAMSEDDPCGATGPFMLEASISSTKRIAAFWGLTSEAPAAQRTRQRSPAAATAPMSAKPGAEPAAALPVLRSVRPTRIDIPQDLPKASRINVGKVIEDALRGAGLLR